MTDHLVAARLSLVTSRAPLAALALWAAHTVGASKQTLSGPLVDLTPACLAALG